VVPANPKFSSVCTPLITEKNTFRFAACFRIAVKLEDFFLKKLKAGRNLVVELVAFRIQETLM
jgi:hypothetical protein